MHANCVPTLEIGISNLFYLIFHYRNENQYEIQSQARNILKCNYRLGCSTSFVTFDYEISKIIMRLLVILGSTIRLPQARYGQLRKI